jgi:hypothetical protein
LVELTASAVDVFPPVAVLVNVTFGGVPQLKFAVPAHVTWIVYVPGFGGAGMVIVAVPEAVVVEGVSVAV